VSQLKLATIHGIPAYQESHQIIEGTTKRKSTTSFLKFSTQKGREVDKDEDSDKSKSLKRKPEFS